MSVKDHYKQVARLRRLALNAELQGNYGEYHRLWDLEEAYWVAVMPPMPAFSDAAYRRYSVSKWLKMPIYDRLHTLKIAGKANFQCAS